ncbi:unnamed protein product [Parajaminaea phylloscopi]
MADGGWHGTAPYLGNPFPAYKKPGRSLQNVVCILARHRNTYAARRGSTDDMHPTDGCGRSTSLASGRRG